MTANGYFRVAAAVPSVNVADCKANARSIIELARESATQGALLTVFPEMAVTGYTCADLFHNSTLLSGASAALCEIAEASLEIDTTIIVGAPISIDATLYNCGIVINNGKILAAIPKTYVPNYNEFYEKRWWASGAGTDTITSIGQHCFPVSSNILVEINGVKIGTEICEDLWTPIPPSTHAAMQGAQILVNLSASDDVAGKYDYLISLLRQQSARCLAAYVYSSAGYGESSTDLVFDGKAIIAENGTILKANKRWQQSPSLIVSDIDIEAIDRDRRHIGSFNDCAKHSCPTNAKYSIIHVDCKKSDDGTSLLLRDIDPRPFVPATDNHIDDRCSEIIAIQVAGLAKRLDATHTRSLVVGISGGLDSTLALMIACRTFDRLGLDRKGITGVTMPGFGTTDRTYRNAMTLMETLGVTIREISIAPSVLQHFADIGHDPDNHDITYENSQARERTQILMDIANQTGGMVLGTGDLSELALGWATYNGDHMSMYGVNAGVPKTLVRYLVRWFAMRADNDTERSCLTDIIDTPISPELIPADANGNIQQKTEDLVGPYELHDFFLYHTLRYGFSPARIYFMARHAFIGLYSDDTIKKWIKVFFRRFFNQQFKRSCLPDGPKVGSVCLSPRGDWRMPSDASVSMWLAECENL